MKMIKKRYDAYTICISALMVVVMTVLSQIVISLGPVPFNLGVMGAYLTGYLLDPGAALCTICCYLLMGALGLPVFAGFSGGPQVLFGMTGGYIAGYVLISFLTSVSERNGAGLIAGMAIKLMALLLCYALGTAWFMYLSGMSLYASLAVCVIPFVIPDLLKLIAAAKLAMILRRRLGLTL